MIWVKPENVNCSGCSEKGVKFSHCLVCEIRKCSFEKGLKNCSFCNYYPCERLETFFGYVPQAKVNLESK
ncbi:MAG: hypothetical protein B6226_03985 [Candidatus Cloacimonetes bacterium 4572_65]|nr:MAG: hypothetical protein B6226_03985 [Candidatus Cloacimonetes bacterium 4572_65]